mmetsp:Transcript_10992/g.12073  ORF Transcript_10992/g.12073 Transcript_10992/m.12073 type:complete len:321 (-) Transcript_10992:239-1201(-)
MDNQKIVAVGIAAAVGVVTLGAIYYLYSSNGSEENDSTGETQETNQISDPVDQTEEPAFKETRHKRKHEDSEDNAEEEDQKRRKTQAAEAQRRADEQKAAEAAAAEKQRKLKEQARQLREKEEAEAEARVKAEKAKRDAAIAKQKAEEEKARAEAQKKLDEAKAAEEAAEAERLRVLNAVKPIQPEVRASKAHQLASHKLFKVSPTASVVQEAPKRKLVVSLSHCTLTGEGLDISKIKLGERAIFKLQVCDDAGKPVDLPTKDVGFEVEGADGIKKGINKLDVGLFEMFWRPRVAAKYTVSVKVGSHDVGKSPYTFEIKE